MGTSIPDSDIPADTTAQAPSYRQFAPKLEENGYAAIPILPGTKRPDEVGWQDADDNTRQAWREDDRFLRFDNYHLGIRCGGELIAIDVDFTNEEAAGVAREALIAAFGDDLIFRTGQPPKFLVPLRVAESMTKEIAVFERTDETSGEIKVQKIELLGEGQQFVCSGIHPDTGKRYTYDNKRSLLDVTLSDLPLVDLDTLGKFIDDVAERLEGSGWQLRSNSTGRTAATHGIADDPLCMPSAERPGMDLSDEQCREIVLFCLTSLDSGGLGWAEEVGYEKFANIVYAVHNRWRRDAEPPQWFLDAVAIGNYATGENRTEAVEMIAQHWVRAQGNLHSRERQTTFRLFLEGKYKSGKWDAWLERRADTVLPQYVERIEEAVQLNELRSIINESVADARLSNATRGRLAEPLNARWKKVAGTGSPSLKRLRTMLTAGTQDDPDLKNGDPVAIVTGKLENMFQYFVNTRGQPFAEFIENGVRQTFSPDGMIFEDWLTMNTPKRFGVRLPTNQLKEVSNWVGARARASGVTIDTPVRHGYVEAKGDNQVDCYIEEVGDPEGTLIKVSRHGVRNLDVSSLADLPIRFMPGEHSAPSSPHETVANTDLVRRCHELVVNLHVPKGFGPVVLGLLLAWRMPESPNPILVATGQRGSGKSTLASRLLQLVDPRTDGTPTTPSRRPDLRAALASGYATIIDNVSGKLTQAMSDDLCVAADGGTATRRKLYKDSGMIALSQTGPVLLTAITNPLVAADVLDRCLVLSLEPVPDALHADAEVLARKWRDALPQHRSTLRALHAASLRDLETMGERRGRGAHRYGVLERMTDAVCQVLGIDTTFAEILAIGAADALEDAFEASLFAQDLELLAHQGGGESTAWSSADLLAKLERMSTRTGWVQRLNDQTYPSTANHVRTRASELVDVLAERGVKIEILQKSNSFRRIRITFSEFSGTNRIDRESEDPADHWLDLSSLDRPANDDEKPSY